MLEIEWDHLELAWACQVPHWAFLALYQAFVAAGWERGSYQDHLLFHRYRHCLILVDGVLDYCAYLRVG